MSNREQGRFSTQAGVSEAEATLRLIASLPAPEGLTERIQAGLQAELQAAPRMARVLAWPGAASATSGWLRGAAAAAIVVVVAGGGWGIYARVQPGVPGHAVAGPRLAAPGGFSEGSAARRPHTLEGPAVPAAVAPAPKSAGQVSASGAAKQKTALTSKPVVNKAVPPQVKPAP